MTGTATTPLIAPNFSLHFPPAGDGGWEGQVVVGGPCGRVPCAPLACAMHVCRYWAVPALSSSRSQCLCPCCVPDADTQSVAVNVIRMS